MKQKLNFDSLNKLQTLPLQFLNFVHYIELIKAIDWSELDLEKSFIEVDNYEEPSENLFMNLKPLKSNKCEIIIDLDIVSSCLHIGYDKMQLAEIMIFSDIDQDPFKLIKSLLQTTIRREKIYSKKNKLLRIKYWVEKNKQASITYQITKFPILKNKEVITESTIFEPWIV